MTTGGSANQGLSIAARLTLEVLDESTVLKAIGEPGARRVRSAVNDALTARGIPLRLSRSEVREALTSLGRNLRATEVRK